MSSSNQFVPAGLQNGVNGTYTLPLVPSDPSTFYLWFNGDLLKNGVDYTLAGNVVTLLYFRPNAASTPPDYLVGSFLYGSLTSPPVGPFPGSASFWGQLVNFEAALRKPLLVPFGLFNAQDNLAFIASVSSSSGLSLSSVAYSSALSIDLSLADVITVLLTGNVASMTLNYAGTANVSVGQRNWIRLLQNATGGWTVNLPANLNYDPAFAVDPDANRATVLPVMWNGANWIFFDTAFSVPTA
jgi:hypothetical protein